MSENKTSISQASSYLEAGEYWDNHDLSEVWEETKAIEFEVDAQRSMSYFPVELNLSKKLRQLAHQHGVSPETLVNLWLQERVGQEQNESAT